MSENGQIHFKNLAKFAARFLLLTLNIFHTFSSVSIVDFEQVNVGWVFRKQKIFLAKI